MGYPEYIQENLQESKPGSVNYIVYDINGKILRTGKCPYTVLEIQAGNEGEFVIEGIANDLIHQIDVDKKIVVDKPIEIKEEEVDDKQKEDREMIMAKMNEILRNLAVEELKKEGKLKEDFE